MKILKWVKDNKHVIFPIIVLSIIIGVLFFLGRSIYELFSIGIGSALSIFGFDRLKRSNDKKEKEFKEQIINVDDELEDIERRKNNETKRINNLNHSDLLNEVNEYNRNRKRN